VTYGIDRADTWHDTYIQLDTCVRFTVSKQVMMFNFLKTCRRVLNGVSCDTVNQVVRGRILTLPVRTKERYIIPPTMPGLHCPGSDFNLIPNQVTDQPEFWSSEFTAER
jgi:hypothetical protein